VLRSDNQGRVLAGLFVKDQTDPGLFASDDLGCDGFTLYYSSPLSPASVAHRLLGQWGRQSLLTRLGQTGLEFGLLSFFQINPEVFEKALKDMTPWLDRERKLIDYYSGVGAISLNLAGHTQETILVDDSEDNIRFALKNIQANQIGNTQAVLCQAQKMVHLIERESIVIFDPPRCGLHPKLIQQVLTQKPVRILYLSCNPLSQAKDLESLKDAYALKSLRVYNFFPRTPHLECLCVLDRI
jgi:23S rRNA (uracil1939-C5)-methyltransferase